MRYILLIIFFISRGLSAQEISITKYGAKPGDGIDNTKAIQTAIDECNQKGGGEIIFPSGIYQTGSIQLKSNVHLRLMPGCIILGSPKISDYPDHYHDVRTRLNVQCENKSLIYAFNAENISVSGSGTIDLNGKSDDFNEVRNIMTGRKTGKEGYHRPYGIRFIKCRHVKVSDITLIDSPFWTQHYFECSFVALDNIKVNGACRANNDGIDIDGCDHVTITRCMLNTADDALCFKSESSKPCEYITVSDCILSCHCNAIKMGTGSLGGFKNISIQNCIIQPKICSHHSEIVSEYLKEIDIKTISGISLEIVDGGRMENITINNICMDSVETPIFIKLGNMARVPDSAYIKPGVGVMKNIIISNITATRCGKTTSSITGLPGYPVENIILSNIMIQSGGGMKVQNLPVPENETHYPEPFMFHVVLPASGFYIRHAKNITLSDITFQYRKHDDRPLLIFEDTTEKEINNVK